MIVTVTMNPAIDKTVEIESMIVGGLNRIKKVVYDVGGKGINVSKTIRELGGDSIATGFLCGSTGKMIEHALTELGIQHDFVWVTGENRTNTKVFEHNGAVTELNEAGPVIEQEQLDELIQKLMNYANEQTLFVLSGSVPQGIEKDIYAEIIRHVHEKGAQVLLDADGDLFKEALPMIPDIIKPNRAELLEYAGMDADASINKLMEIADSFISRGIDMIAVSMGQEGAIFYTKSFRAVCPAIQIKAHSTVGAGDAMVAALAYAWGEEMSDTDTVRLCMATSAGAVTTIGTKPPNRKKILELIKQVEIERVPL